MKISESIEIDAAPAVIWTFLVNPDLVLKWCTTFKTFRYMGDQRSGCGTPLYIEENAGMGLTRMQFVVQDWTENERLDLKMVSGANYGSYEQRMLLEPSGGRTWFTYTEEIVLPYGVLGKLIGILAERISAKTLHGMLVKLKALAEE